MIHRATILAYHSVHPDRLDGLNVTPKRFGQHMAWLARKGYRGVSLATLAEQMHGLSPAPGKLIAITFDDGYLDNLTHALPILEHFGFAATVFVVSGHVGTATVHTPELLARYPSVPATAYRYLAWDDVRELHRRGIEIGSHTCTHRLLDTLDREQQVAEIVESKQAIEAELGEAIGSFCYPAGHFDPQTPDLVREAGYRQAVVTPWRPGLIRGDQYTLKRVGLYAADNLWRFRFKSSPFFDAIRGAKHRLRPRAR